MSKTTKEETCLAKIKNQALSISSGGVEKIKGLGAAMDKNVQIKPYHYIAGAAILGLALGVLISRKK